MAWEVKRPAVEGADASSRGWRGDSVGGLGGRAGRGRWIKPCVFALSGQIEADSGDNLAEAAQTCPVARGEGGEAAGSAAP